MPATSTVARSGNAEIDGVLSGYKWASTSLTYSLPTSVSQYGYSIAGFQAFNSAQATAVKAVLSTYAAVSNLSFTQLTGTQAGSATIRYAEMDNAGTAYAYYPSMDAKGGDAWFNHTDYNTPVQGTYAYMTLLHETGHTLGLDHGQDGTAALPTDHDSLEYSVMTYRSYVGAPLSGYTVREGSYPTGLMMADIAAIQYMYGADYTTNSGATTYKWNPSTGAMSVNGVITTDTATNTVFQTIWDGGGNDTYDLSSYTTAVSVNLNPGSWTKTSSAQLADLGNGHYARGNIANAYLYKSNPASLIENANGGSSNDSLTGNQANNVLRGNNGNDVLSGGTGNDSLYGGVGADSMTGGAGVDSFVFNTALSSANVDKVCDFAVGTDKLVLENAIFTKLAAGALPTEDFAYAGTADVSHAHLVYSKTSGWLSYDADEGGSGAALHFATLATGLALHATDFQIC
jgi:serralysin